MSKITIGMLPASTILGDNDFLPIYVSQEGTKKITAEDVKESVFNIFTGGYQENVSEGDFIVLQNNIPKKLSYDGLKNYLIGDQQEDIEEKGYASINDVYGCGREIPNNSNLNNYTTLGKYYYNSASSGTSIDNYPTEDETIPKFSMTVEDLTSDIGCQTVRPVDTYAYAKRTFEKSQDYTRTNDTTVIENKNYYQYITQVSNCFETQFDDSATYYKPNNYIYFKYDEEGMSEGTIVGSVDEISIFRGEVVLTYPDPWEPVYSYNITLPYQSGDPTIKLYFKEEDGDVIHVPNVDQEEINDYFCITITLDSDPMQLSISDPNSLGLDVYSLNTIITKEIMTIDDLNSNTEQPDENTFSEDSMYYYTTDSYLDEDPIENPTGNPYEQSWYEKQISYDFTNSEWKIVPEIVISPSP